MKSDKTYHKKKIRQQRRNLSQSEKMKLKIEGLKWQRQQIAEKIAQLQSYIEAIDRQIEHGQKTFNNQANLF